MTTEQNNPPVVMDTPYNCNLRGNNLPEEIITNHNIKYKLKVQVGFVIKIVVLCTSLYLYSDKVRIDDMMEESTG